MGAGVSPVRRQQEQEQEQQEQEQEQGDGGWTNPTAAAPAAAVSPQIMLRKSHLKFVG